MASGNTAESILSDAAFYTQIYHVIVISKDASNYIAGNYIIGSRGDICQQSPMFVSPS